MSPNRSAHLNTAPSLQLFQGLVCSTRPCCLSCWANAMVVRWTLSTTARQVVDKVQRTTIALAQQLKQQGLVEHTKPWNNCSEGAVLRWADRFGDMGLNSHLPYCRLNQPRLVPAMRAYEAARWE